MTFFHLLICVFIFSCRETDDTTDHGVSKEEDVSYSYKTKHVKFTCIKGDNLFPLDIFVAKMWIIFLFLLMFDFVT